MIVRARSYFDGPCKSLAIRQAKTVRSIFGFVSTISSGNAYIGAPIFLAMEIAYNALSILV